MKEYSVQYLWLLVNILILSGGNLLSLLITSGWIVSNVQKTTHLVHFRESISGKVHVPNPYGIVLQRQRVNYWKQI